MKRINSIVWGLALLAVSAVLILNAFEITNIEIFFDGWWTLFIIVPSFIGLLTDRDKTGNIIGLVIGVFLLLACQNILDFDIMWKLIVPVIIAVIGIKMILGGIGETSLVLVGTDNDYKIELDKGIGEAWLDGKKMSDDSFYGSGSRRIEIDGGVGELNISFTENSGERQL